MKDVLIEEIDKIVSSYIQSKRPAGVFATSLDIAAVTKKEHKTILRDIRNMMVTVDRSELNISEEELFTEMFYSDTYGRDQKMMALTEEGFMIILSGYSFTLRYKLVKFYSKIKNSYVTDIVDVLDLPADILRDALSIVDNRNRLEASITALLEYPGIKPKEEVEKEVAELRKKIQDIMVSDRRGFLRKYGKATLEKQKTLVR
jgi:hypothetical protein